MKTVYAVELNMTGPPVFPDRCPVCGDTLGEKHAVITMDDEHGRVDFYLYGIVKAPAQGTLLQIPVHDFCARQVRNRFLIQALLASVAAAAVITLGVLLHLHALVWASAAPITAVVILYFPLTTPVPVEFYWTQGRYVLLFTNQSVAQEVARLNDAQVNTRAYPMQ